MRFYSRFSLADEPALFSMFSFEADRAMAFSFAFAKDRNTRERVIIRTVSDNLFFMVFRFFSDLEEQISGFITS